MNSQGSLESSWSRDAAHVSHTWLDQDQQLCTRGGHGLAEASVGLASRALSGHQEPPKEALETTLPAHTTSRSSVPVLGLCVSHPCAWGLLRGA